MRWLYSTASLFSILSSLCNGLCSSWRIHVSSLPASLSQRSLYALLSSAIQWIPSDEPRPQPTCSSSLYTLLRVSLVSLLLWIESLPILPILILQYPQLLVFKKRRWMSTPTSTGALSFNIPSTRPTRRSPLENQKSQNPHLQQRVPQQHWYPLLVILPLLACLWLLLRLQPPPESLLLFCLLWFFNQTSLLVIFLSCPPWAPPCCTPLLIYVLLPLFQVQIQSNSKSLKRSFMILLCRPLIQQSFLIVHVNKVESITPSRLLFFILLCSLSPFVLCFLFCAILCILFIIETVFMYSFILCSLSLFFSVIKWIIFIVSCSLFFHLCFDGIHLFIWFIYSPFALFSLVLYTITMVMCKFMSLFLFLTLCFAHFNKQETTSII